MATEKKGIYYHHTDRDSAKKILESGVIKQSDQRAGDAAHGPGTYVTKDIGPGATPSQVARNNYDGMTPYWEGKAQQGKADVIFEVKVPESKVKNCNAPQGRDVHLHKGDIPLPPDTKVHVRGKDGVQTYTLK